MDIDFSNLKVDDSGRVSFSGIGSGIDFESTVENIIQARRIPVDRLETNIETNDLKIAAFQDLEGLLGALQTSLSTLRGAVSFDNSADVFKAKEAFASVSRTDGANPSGAANLIGVTVTNAAAADSHEIELLQFASAHKIATDSYASTGTALGFSDGDSFTIEGQTVSLTAQDTLLTLRDRINAANTGTNATGVSASIVTASATQHYLVLSKSTQGAEIDIAETSGTPLQTAGVMTGASAFKNQLQAAQTAQLYADGLLDKTNTTFETARQSSASITLGSNGTIRFDDGNTTRDLAYGSSDSLTDFAASINGDATLQGMGISASVVQEGGQVRLKIATTGDAFTMTEQGAGSALTDLGMNNSRLLVERNTNTVNDLFAGVTLSLFQAEVGSNIRIDIERNLATVKSQVASFVEAYNATKAFINSQSAIDETGKVSEETVLYGSRALADIESRLGQILGAGTQGVNAGYSVLAQIGVEFVDNAALSDPLLKDTLTIDEGKLDTALLNSPDDVRRLFSFDFSSSDPRVTLLGFTGKTSFDASGYALNVAFTEVYQGGTVTTADGVLASSAMTGGFAGDGIGAITFDGSVTPDTGYRYAYDSATEELTLYDLTSGTSETVDITAALDAVAGASADLGAGETLDVAFATLNATITLSGDEGFVRASDIGAGQIDSSGFPADLAFTSAQTTLASSGIGKAAVDALIAAGAYDPATGQLTLSVDASVSNQAYLQTAAGIGFSLDGSPVSPDISGIDLDDGAAHSIGIYVNDGGSDVLVGTLGFDAVSNTSSNGTQGFTVDLGTGLVGLAEHDTSATAPLSNYLSVTDGSFEIRDSANTLIGTVNYLADDSLTDLKDTIDAIAGVTASIVSDGGTFRLQVTDDDSTPLTFTADTGGVVASSGLTNRGTQIASANIGGSADGLDNGTVTVKNGVLTMTDATGAEGLQVLYTGNTDASGIQLDFTTGIGSRLYFSVDDVLDETTGTVKNEIEALDDQNDFTQERIDTLLARLARQRESLITRFINMETALSSMNSLLEQVKQSFAAMTKKE